MNFRTLSTNRFFCILFLLLFASGFMIAQVSDPVRPWKGFAVLGNGNLCAVYSDDTRTNGKGIQRLYYHNYTCSYIQNTSSTLFRSGLNTALKTIKRDSLGMSNFFTTSTLSYYANSIVKEVNCFAHPDNAIVLSVALKSSSINIFQHTKIVLPIKIITDRLTSLQTIKVVHGKAMAVWSNHTTMVIGCADHSQKISVSDSVVSVFGKIGPSTKIDIVITLDKTTERAMYAMNTILSEKDLSSSAENYWEAWINKGVLPQFSPDSEKLYSEYYKRNLYCAKAVCLHGFVPADITGFFTTNNMPQLYPRDAMMCARSFLLTGHLAEAKEVITFWANKMIPMKHKGEWYARYDAFSNAVDAGSGARYDEPEWDANGYFIQLLDMYHQKTSTWLADTCFVFDIADFLVSKLDKNGLLYEGGIIEWTGYLPATNMTCSAALKTASRIASEFGDQKRAISYEQASVKISSSLSIMFDKRNNTYADLRFAGKKDGQNKSLPTNRGDSLYLWNTTMNFGVLWGYPNHREVTISNDYYQNTTVKKNGGVQYFTSPDAWLAGYGHCMFIFSTAARAQYLSIYGDIDRAKLHIDWMIRNSNTYGLMPERIAIDDSDPTPASPLSWCSAEFAAALLLYKTVKR